MNRPEHANSGSLASSVRVQILWVLLASSVLLSPTWALGAPVITGPVSVSAVFGDDTHTATLNPYPMIAVSSLTYAGNPALNGQCVWINAGLNAFVAANPANGSGPTGQGWSYTWAGVAQEAAVEQGISLVSYTSNGKTYDGYNPYVVSQPDVTAGNGINYPSDITNAEVGGAVLNLKYTPQAGAPAINNLHWIQAYTGSIFGTAFGPIWTITLLALTCHRPIISPRSTTHLSRAAPAMLLELWPVVVDGFSTRPSLPKSRATEWSTSRIRLSVRSFKWSWPTTLSPNNP